MGCWPYLTLLAQYVKEVSGFYSATSLSEMHRKLRWIGLELRRLKREKRIGTDNPAKMGKLDIMELLKSMKERDLSVNTVSKQITQLKFFLEWCGNPVIGNIQKLRSQAIPKQRVRRLSSLSSSEAERILNAVEKMPGWRGRVAGFLMATYIYCGLRMSELRLAHIDDLDVDTWTLMIRHPKGEDSWGEKRTVYIPEPCRKYVIRYLEARGLEMSKRNIEEDLEPLVPSLSPRGRDGYYTPNGIEYIKCWVERESGVKFQIRTLRRTYGQLLLDRGVSIDAVSKSMGHSSTKTTETYYCRKSDAAVREEIDRAWNIPNSTRKFNSAKNTLIESEKYISGYG
jgi:integrase/recombinase XerD